MKFFTKLFGKKVSDNDVLKTGQIPDFLKEFESDLQKYKLEYIEIHTVSLKENETLGFKQSKFLGKPYLPVGMDYPKDKSGKPLILWAQLNFSEIPHLEGYPERGILQFFVSSNDWYGMNEYKVLYHENTEEEMRTDFSFLTKDLYEDCPIGCEYKLNFTKETECASDSDFRFDYTYKRETSYDFWKSLTEEQRTEKANWDNQGRHKIGGYCTFTQGDPRSFGSKRENDISLLQIDSDFDKIMFGDCGVAHFFINKEELKNKSFEKVWFYWDCC